MKDKKDLIRFLESLSAEVKEEAGGILYARLDKNKVPQAIEDLYATGFDYLATITCVDLGDDRHCELIYNLYSFSMEQRLFLACLLDYETDRQPTVMHLWPHAQFYEREIYEMFGLHFAGNPDYDKPFIFEGNDPAHPRFPMRKSFDSIRFSLEHYGERDYGGKKG